MTADRRERPIIFSAESVRAILAGRKTQTRRLVKLTDSGRVKEPGSPRNWHLDDPDAVNACPFGRPGDRLWVRETWSDCCPLWPHWCGCGSEQMRKETHTYLYRADTDDARPERFTGRHSWRPSIHMPRWASRLTLEITDVRVQRLQDISEDDAKAEGVERLVGISKEQRFCGDGTKRTQGTHPDSLAFACAWDTIHFRGGEAHWWIGNPWVWAITFRRADREDACS